MCNSIEMSKYYNFRKEVRKLYQNDVQNIGDLCCKILEIRDKYRSVESIELKLQEYTINVELSENTSATKKQEIISKIALVIGYYIVNNRILLDESINNDPDFEIFINSNNMIYCDIIVVGNSITFNL